MRWSSERKMVASFRTVFFSSVLFQLVRKREENTVKYYVYAIKMQPVKITDLLEGHDSMLAYLATLVKSFSIHYLQYAIILSLLFFYWLFSRAFCCIRLQWNAYNSSGRSPKKGVHLKYTLSLIKDQSHIPLDIRDGFMHHLDPLVQQEYSKFKQRLRQSPKFPRGVGDQ